MRPSSAIDRSRHTPAGSTRRATARALLVASVLATAALGALPAHADAGSRGEAIEQALAQSGGGKVLGVTESTGRDGRKEYAVKVLTDGRVRVVRVRGR